MQLAAGVLILYGLSPKFGALLVALPRPVLGGVFVLVCALIIASGLALLARAEVTLANSLVAGMTLVASVGLPVYAQYGLGPEWLATLPEMARLLITNGVVIAVIGAVGLNLLLTELPRRFAATD